MDDFVGGMQALEWSILGASTRFAEYTAHYEEQYPPTATTTTSVSSSKPFVRSAIVIGANASHNAWQIAFGEAQRRAIYADPLWNHGSGSEVQEGLRIARMLAMITYRYCVGCDSVKINCAMIECAFSIHEIPLVSVVMFFANTL